MSALDYSNTLGIYNASSLQQQSSGRYVAQLSQIILFPSQSVFDLTPFEYALFGEAAYTNYIVFWV